MQEAPSSQALLRQGETELGLGDSSRAGAAATVADGEALLREGLAKKAQGDVVTAQKLFDRARIALERATAERAALEPNAGIWDVSAITWSGDGTRLAIASGQDVRILDGNDFSEYLRVHSDARLVTAIAISPDARALVSAGGDRDLELWDLASGARAGTLEMTGTPPDSLVFSPDGRSIAGRSWGNSAPTLWCLGTPSTAEALPADHRGRFLGIRGGTGQGRWPDMVAFSPDGAMLASVHESSLIFWALRSDGPRVSGVIQAAKAGSEGDRLSSVTFDPSGRSVAAASDSGIMLLWNGFAGGAAPRTVRASQSNARLAFSRNGDSILLVSGEGDVRTYATKTLTRLTAFEAGAGAVAAVAPRADAASAVIAADGGLVVVDAASGKRTEVVARPVSLSAVAVSQDGARLALGTAAGPVLLLTLGDGSFSWLKAHRANVESLAFSPDGRWLATASRDKTARIWDVLGHKSLRVLEHPEPLNAVAFRSDGRTLATAGENGLVRLWDVPSGEKLASLGGTSCAVLSVAFSRDGSLLAANASNHSVLRWNIQNYASLPQLTRGADCEGELGAPTNSLGVTGDGETIVSAVGNSVAISDAQSGQVQIVLPADAQGSPVRSVAISPNEPVAAAAAGTRVRRWHLPEGAELSALVTGSSAEQVDSLVFSADGRWLFGAGRRGNLSVWSLPRGSLELTLRWANETSAFALAPSGLMEWLGQNKAPATCRLGPRLYAADLCEERYAFKGLVGNIFARRVSAMAGGEN